MSMSQEEIESLMNGLDFDDEPAQEPSVEENNASESMSEDDINDLIAQTEDIVPNEEEHEASEESVDDLLNSIEDASSQNIDNDTNIDDILKELEQDDNQAQEEIAIPDDIIVPNLEEEVQEIAPLDLVEDIVPQEPSVDESLSSTVSNDDMEDLLSSIDGIQESAPLQEVSYTEPSEDIDRKINSGVFPLPVDEDTKVVNQLNAVATDSEEKATKIFDVLSNILDYNNGIQTDIQALSTFNEKQVAMLSSLSQKFPNIEAFKVNLDQANEMGNYIQDANNKLNDGNTEIFQAMELMQYHDINRQKIERVMSVIRKLSLYLNNLFEDDNNNRDEVAVAKHIHGDNNSDLVADDDLEALIAEFNN